LLDDDDDDDESGYQGVAEIHRKTVANGFWNHEVEEELRAQGMDDFLFKTTSDREKAMSKIDELRATTIYEHKECSEECRRRGMYYACMCVCMYGLGKLIGIERSQLG